MSNPYRDADAQIESSTESSDEEDVEEYYTSFFDQVPKCSAGEQLSLLILHPVQQKCNLERKVVYTTTHYQRKVLSRPHKSGCEQIEAPRVGEVVRHYT